MTTSSEIPQGFKLPEAISFDSNSQEPEVEPIKSSLSKFGAIESAQLVTISEGQGTILHYPKRCSVEVGDVLFLRERSGESDENGIVVQVISLGTASYPQADTKALFRLMVNVRAVMLERSYNEPPEVIDEFLIATFKTRASIVKGKWMPPEGRVVTRNVDIFILDPTLLTSHILEKVENLNIHIGNYKGEPVEFFGGGIEKINLITGMKGAGKSHIAKGIIAESLKGGMSAVVFDINNEYQGLPDSYTFYPGINLRFRLDRIQPKTLLDMIERIAPFAERTGLIVRSELPGIINSRAADANHVPDLDFLIKQDTNVISGKGEWVENMRASYRSSLEVMKNYRLIMTESEAKLEDQFMKQELNIMPEVVSLSSVLYNIEQGQKPGVIVFNIGGLLSFIQHAVVDFILDTLKEISRKQTQAYKNKAIHHPNYPTIYFEEAHMYMEPKVINELLPLIRHHGMNVFFITNTPGSLPDSVFRLMDNVIITRLINKKDIDQVKNCGLADADTIEGFASNLREYHALFLSGIGGATKNFPLVFQVRDFGLPTSGETRSMWRAMREAQGKSKD